MATLVASFATAASAQSSVTLYGLVDAGLTYVNNVQSPAGSGTMKSSQFGMNGGNVQMSRWGLRGAEDLGGGMKAIFTLESGFDVANGSSLGGSNSMFGRQAFVGLSSGFGTVTLGKQTDSVTDYLGPVSATGTWGGTYFAHPGNLDNLNGDAFRLNNSVKFQSANYSGLTFGGSYAFSNTAGSFAANRAYSAGVGYANGPLKAGAAYTQSNGANSNGAGAITGGSPTISFANGYTSLANVNDLRLRTFGAGASYSIGAVTFGGLWSQVRQDANSVDGKVVDNNIEVNGRYALTPALAIGAAYTFTLSKVTYGGGDGSNIVRYHQFGLQTDYALSKRTDIYAEGVVQLASGLDKGEYPTARIGGFSTASSSGRQVLVTTGIRHRF
nr:porin [Caballeronia hypogeia]